MKHKIDLDEARQIEQAARIQELKDDLETAKTSLRFDKEEIEQLRVEMENYGDDFVCQTKCKDARIKELKADLEQSEICIQARMDVIEAQAIQIKELENALVEERARVITSHPLTHVIDEDRTEASMQLQAEGKIGNGDHIAETDQMVPCWQITEERIGLLEYCLETLLDAPDIEEIPGPGHSIEMLRAMLKEAGQ